MAYRNFFFLALAMLLAHWWLSGFCMRVAPSCQVHRHLSGCFFTVEPASALDSGCGVGG